MTLSEAILEGSIDKVVHCLQAGAPLNVFDEYGYTPLIHATATNRADLVALLLAHHAQTHLVDLSGSTALHWATDNDNVAICKLLLKHGADPNAYNANSQSPLFYPVLRKHKALIDLLVQAGGNVAFAKDFILAKLVGHRFELQGKSDIVTPEGLFIAIDLEGFYLEFTLDIIRESLERFLNSFAAHRTPFPYQQALTQIIQALQNARDLRTFKHFSKDAKDHRLTIQALLKHDLLLLPVSFMGHAITFIKQGRFFAKCDRGVQKMTDPIVIHTLGRPHNLTEDFLMYLLYERHKYAFIQTEIPQVLALTPYTKLPIKHQITGNCSWANVEASVPTMLYMLLHDKIGTPSEAHKLVTDIMQFYHRWLEWDKDRILEDWLDHFEDLSLSHQKARAALLAAIFFQALLPQREYDIIRARKILKILSRKEFHYLVRIYANVFMRAGETKNTALQQLMLRAGYTLSQFRH